jgi:hypothetical protein
LSVAHSAFNGGGLRLGIEPNDMLLRTERKKLGSGIGKFVEAMARAQYLELMARLHKPLNIFARNRSIHSLRAVLEVSSPVCQLALYGPPQLVRK